MEVARLRRLECIALAVEINQHVMYNKCMNNICTEPNCTQLMIARKLCDKHYRRLRKYGTTSLPEKPIMSCSADCNNIARTKGLCTKHYSRLLRHGSISHVSRHVSTGDRYSGMPEYVVWANMKSRCRNISNNQYHNYGARGIQVCDEWVNNFPRFLNDMGKRPSDKHTIDRIDNSKGYSKQNCRWTTNKENCNNTRRNKYIKYNGLTMSYTQWSERLGGGTHLVSDRIRLLGWSEDKAVTTPPRKNRQEST